MVTEQRALICRGSRGDRWPGILARQWQDARVADLVHEDAEAAVRAA
jgi:hypothetical protein